jgi:putative intracellular protease/amidase
MHVPKAYLYVFDTMADWEPGYLIAELNTGRYFKKGAAPLEVIAVGVDAQPVTTMGGMNILPRMSVDACQLERTDVLILPGGTTWMEAIHEPMLNKAAAALQAGTVVAAICGATLALAKTGLLDARRHTSNDLDFLKMVCPDYRGETYYDKEPAVTDGNLVTASGAAPLAFAMQVLKALDVFAPDTAEAWFDLYRTNEPQYFFALMDSIQ